MIWLTLVLIGLLIAALAVAFADDLGTGAAPFFGRYRIAIKWVSLLAPLVAVSVLWTASRPRAARLRWGVVVWGSYVAALAWTLSLGLLDTRGGLGHPLTGVDGYLPNVTAAAEPLDFLAAFTGMGSHLTAASSGHPPGPLLLLALLVPLVGTGPGLGVALTALSTLTVPLVLIAAKSAVGERAARRYAPLLVLAPWAIWVAVSMDGVTSALLAATMAMGAYASERFRKGLPAFGTAVAAGLLLGVSTMFSYAAAWMGLALVFLNFARRRPFHNVWMGAGALAPLLVAQLLGFNWMAGLRMAYADYSSRIESQRPWAWWAALSLVVLLVACGPALVASARKMRNTPGWPFLVGSAVAVVFSVVAGLARGGVEHAWLPFFPWLTLAATAPARPGGPPSPLPVGAAAVGAVTAVIVEAVLLSPW
ncbi:hypothetical protein [Actinorhabdospora filicis]|uniref:hypothetical protein n=1 Tax=Actinorhabdospora filicis TaxID=1785913 RepID=UPI002552AE9E|nr:hypothetical protein [Actinorhabdospora filicis]